MSEMALLFHNPHVSCEVSVQGHAVRVAGRVLQPEAYAAMEVVAPCPPDRRASYTGSALPFPCAGVAFCGTPNRARVAADGRIDAAFAYPNAYYLADWNTRVAPSVFVILHPPSGDAVFVRLELPDPLPLKTLTHRPERTGPEFYARKADILGVQSQEAILRAMGATKEQHGVA